MACEKQIVLTTSEIYELARAAGITVPPREQFLAENDDNIDTENTIYIAKNGAAFQWETEYPEEGSYALNDAADKYQRDENQLLLQRKVDELVDFVADDNFDNLPEDVRIGHIKQLRSMTNRLDN